MLDGQTIVLDDYLLMRPEMAQTLREHIQSGRILIGPWHILPDMFLVSPEAHIRNLLAGERDSAQMGTKDDDRLYARFVWSYWTDAANPARFRH